MDRSGLWLEPGLGIEPLDDLELVRDLLGGEAHLAADLRVLVALQLLHEVADHAVGGRALEAEVPELQAQALLEVAARHPGGIEGLHDGERLLHLRRREGAHARDLVEAGAEQAVLVEVVDDGVADLEQLSSEVAMRSCQSRWS